MATWEIDSSHSSVTFAVRHLVIAKVRGRFGQFAGRIELDGADVTAGRVSVAIETASINTDEPKRDGHLRSPDFFDVEKYPQMTFASDRIEARDAEHFKLHGQLTLHGVTRPVVLDVESLGRAKDPWGGERMAFSAHTAVDRKDFGLTWNQALEAGGLLVGDKVEIALEVEAIRKG